MRVAILLAGHARTYRQTISSFWATFGHLNPDVFFHTWSVTGASDKLWWTHGEQNIEKTDCNDLIRLYDPKAYDMEDEIQWEECDLPKQHHGDYSRMRSQWYSPLRAMELTEEWGNYDVIIKTRFDIDYAKTFQAKQLPVLANGKYIQFAPYPISIQRNVYSDTVVIAASDVMQQYLNYFHHIEQFFELSKVQMGVPGYCSEYGATAYMAACRFWGCTPRYTDLQPSIIRNDGSRIKLYS